MTPYEVGLALFLLIVGVPVFFWYLYRIDKELREMSEEERRELGQFMLEEQERDRWRF